MVVEARDLPLIPPPLNLPWLAFWVWPRWVLRTLAAGGGRAVALVAARPRGNKVGTSEGSQASSGVEAGALEAGNGTPPGGDSPQHTVISVDGPAANGNGSPGQRPASPPAARLQLGPVTEAADGAAPLANGSMKGQKGAVKKAANGTTNGTAGPAAAANGNGTAEEKKEALAAEAAVPEEATAAAARPPALTIVPPTAAVDGDKKPAESNGGSPPASPGGDAFPASPRSPNGAIVPRGFGSAVGRGSNVGGAAGGNLGSSLPEDAPAGWCTDSEMRREAAGRVLEYLQLCLAPQDWREEQHQVAEVLKILGEQEQRQRAAMQHHDAHGGLLHAPGQHPHGLTPAAAAGGAPATGARFSQTAGVRMTPSALIRGAGASGTSGHGGSIHVSARGDVLPKTPAAARPAAA